MPGIAERAVLSKSRRPLGLAERWCRSSDQRVVVQVDGALFAGSIHRDDRLCYPAPRRRVGADHGILRPTDENSAVRGDAIELARAKGVAAYERLADGVAGDPHAVGVADENRVDVGIVDLVALDRHVAILEIVLKALGAVRGGHANIDGAESAAAVGQLVGAGDAVGEAVVSEDGVLCKSGLGPEADVASRLQRDPRGVGELAILDH